MSKPRAPRPGSIRILYKLAIFDLDARVMPHKGHVVEVVQPFGCPPNGTMGHCYVDCVTCGEAKAELLDIDPAKSRIFIGLVCLGSLYKPNEPVEVLATIPACGPVPTKYRVRTAEGGERVTAKVPDYLLSN
jgi:hypothetical protein